MDEIPELVDLLFALQDKAAKWFIIGLHLRLSLDELDIIKADSDGVEECLRNVLRKWRSKPHPPSTWRTLIAALREAAVGEEVLAGQLEVKFTVSELPSCRTDIQEPGNSAKCETSIEVSRRNLVKIKESFATVLKDVAGKLKTMELDMETFHFFMIALFPPGTCIPQSYKVIEIFEAVTRNGLWSYWHYTPVEKIVAEYAPKDNEMKGWLDSYKKQLSGYKAATKIADAIKLYSIDQLEEADPNQRITVTYDPAYLRRLSLKLNTRVTEKSLEYIDDLWVSLAEYFLLPSLSALLDKIQSGCIEVSWLIPPHYAFQIIGNLQENSSYLQLKGIVKVLLDGDCIYDVAQNEECKQKVADAVSAGDIDEIVALLTSGIDVNITLEGSTTLLMLAACKKLTGVLSVLLNYGADIDRRNEYGWTALMLACELGNLEVVEVLLEHNAGVEIKTLNGWTALMLACGQDNSEVVEVLLKYNASIEIQSLDGWTAVMIACCSGHLDIVRMLVKKQANINHRNKKGHTCLMAACQNDHLGVVEFLLTLPQINVKIKDKKGINALQCASYAGNVDVVQALLNHPDVDIDERTDLSNYTALMFACIGNHEKCVELLVSKQANVNIKAKNGWTALKFCCMKLNDGNPRIIQLLLSHDADPNIQDEDGWTPLMTASSNSFAEAVHELLVRGADPNIKSTIGETALQIARENASTSLVPSSYETAYLDIVEQLETCTKVEGASAPLTHADKKIRERQIPVDVIHLDYGASLAKNRRIFREILERGPEMDDPPKPHTSSQPWHQAHQHGQ